MSAGNAAPPVAAAAAFTFAGADFNQVATLFKQGLVGFDPQDAFQVAGQILRNNAQYDFALCIAAVVQKGENIRQIAGRCTILNNEPRLRTNTGINLKAVRLIGFFFFHICPQNPYSVKVFTKLGNPFTGAGCDDSTVARRINHQMALRMQGINVPTPNDEVRNRVNESITNLFNHA